MDQYLRTRSTSKNPRIIINETQDQNGKDTNWDDRVLRNVRVDAPSFDGTLDPIKFLDWLSELRTILSGMVWMMLDVLD